MKIKKGDSVKIISGKDKGKTGKVIAAYPKLQKVVVENVNMHTRFAKAKKAGQKGTQVTFPGAFNVSKVMLLDPSSGSSTRVGFQMLEKGRKQRIAKVSGKAL